MFSTIISLALLASSALSSPLAQRSTLTGTSIGSIFAYGDATAARTLFYNSGSCGLSTYFVGVVPDSMPLIAMPANVMTYYGSAQSNTLCGKIITMTYNGVSRQAAIADTCGASYIDMTSDLWIAFGQKDYDGTIFQGLEWSVVL